MRKLFLNVAASLLFVELVILTQAPGGAAQGPADPDAVATNLVNTSCVSCHPLDRVRSKVADKDAWTGQLSSATDFSLPHPRSQKTIDSASGASL